VSELGEAEPDKSGWDPEGLLFRSERVSWNSLGAGFTPAQYGMHPDLWAGINPAPTMSFFRESRDMERRMITRSNNGSPIMLSGKIGGSPQEKSRLFSG